MNWEKEYTTAESLVTGTACKATFWPAQGLKWRTVEGSRF